MDWILWLVELPLDRVATWSKELHKTLRDTLFVPIVIFKNPARHIELNTKLNVFLGEDSFLRPLSWQ